MELFRTEHIPKTVRLIYMGLASMALIWILLTLILN